MFSVQVLRDSNIRVVMMDMNTMLPLRRKEKKKARISKRNRNNVDRSDVRKSGDMAKMLGITSETSASTFNPLVQEKDQTYRGQDRHTQKTYAEGTQEEDVKGRVL